MWIIGAVAGLILILLTLFDGFETILQPRRVMHRFRYVRFYYRSTWPVWRAVAMRISAGKRREAFLSIFGPLSLLGLFSTWVIGLILGFALFHWSLDTPIRTVESLHSFWNYVYLSGTTFFTLGYGDVTPLTSLGCASGVVEAGMGFAFLAVIISYLPVLYQAFSDRELTISLLDARAGSPPTAGQFLMRLARSGNIHQVDKFLTEWEIWAADLLESHLSFPVLSYYRSQHDNQSWLAALASILDTCAILMVKVKNDNVYQAQLTFAMARHAAVDLALVLKTPPQAPQSDRLVGVQMDERFKEAGLELYDGPAVDAKLAELRGMYEPFLTALAQRSLFILPPIMSEDAKVDNWQSSAWMQRTPGIGNLPTAKTDDEHFK